MPQGKKAREGRAPGLTTVRGPPALSKSLRPVPNPLTGPYAHHRPGKGTSLAEGHILCVQRRCFLNELTLGNALARAQPGKPSGKGDCSSEFPSRQYNWAYLPLLSNQKSRKGVVASGGRAPCSVVAIINYHIFIRPVLKCN